MEKIIILRDRPNLFSPTYWNSIVQTSAAPVKLYGGTLNMEYNFYSKNRMVLAIPKKDWQELSKKISFKIINDKNLFNEIKKRTNISTKRILIFIRKSKKINYSTLSFDELIRMANDIYQLFFEYDTACLFSWFVAGDELETKIKKILRINMNDLKIITRPLKKTYSSQMTEEVLGESLKVKSDAVKLSKKYYWIPFGYDGPKIWDAKYFAKIILINKRNINKTKIQYRVVLKNEDIFRRAVNKIYKKHTFDQRKRRLIDILRTNAQWTDERKMLHFQLFYYYDLLLRELSKRYKIPLKNLKYLLTSELSQLRKSRVQMLRISQDRMSNDFLAIIRGGKIVITSKKERTKIWGLLNERNQVKKVMGQVACGGPELKYFAYAKILRSTKECHKIKNGDLLITTMTTPDFVPAMNRALGFITDEGGITCHAAIVAREMNKPCIIGTKIATRVFKDGDRLQVDVVNGIIKKI